MEMWLCFFTTNVKRGLSKKPSATKYYLVQISPHPLNLPLLEGEGDFKPFSFKEKDGRPLALG